MININPNLISSSIIINSNSAKLNLKVVKEFIKEKILKDFDINLGLKEDIYVLQSIDQKSIKIEQVRELLSKFSYKPHFNNYKFLLILSAEKLTIEAQNALLKTIEEPESKSFIVLTTTNINKILPTIRSRCKLFDLSYKNEIKFPNEKIKELISSNIALKLKFAKEIYSAKENKEILFENFISELIYFININKITKFPNKNKYELLKNLIKYQKYYYNNVNLRLIILCIMIDLEALKLD